ncbi:MAG: acyltransferase domain-containing protein, partial [Chitinivibrionales bacterium]|nr:acyltransferase domain-containing protein [Chitinivibrionales bacterium]MBD3359005.1 acyltransferase domain-containing protein [Chitinivibrionales bacterium]
MGITFLFPGQGSQTVGMGADLYERFDAARARFDAAGEILNRDLKKLCFEGPAEELTPTQNTQPALFTMECALTDVLKEQGLAPSLVLGHSLG